MRAIASAPTEDRRRALGRREHPHCFACRDPAEGGLGLKFAVEPDGGVKAMWECPAGGESYPGMGHGGIVSTLLDAAMVHALFARGVVAQTAELKVRFRRPVCIGRPLVVRAWLREQQASLFVLEAELRQGATLCARGRAKFMQLPRADEGPQGREAPAGTDRRPVALEPIGVIRSEHREAAATPIQPVFAADCPGRAELRPELTPGLDDVEGFSHVYLITWLDRAEAPQLRVKPYLQDVERGIFATRAPNRPNAVGLSLVRVIRREANVLHFAGADMLDGTPLLDIKPYAPRFDRADHPRGGWTEEVDEETAQRRGRRRPVAAEAKPSRALGVNPATRSSTNQPAEGATP